MCAAGDVYVKPEIRKGILPSILAALINARAATRVALKEATTPAQMAVLDSRQKALKLTANALYGFTGNSWQQTCPESTEFLNEPCLHALFNLLLLDTSSTMECAVCYEGIL